DTTQANNLVASETRTTMTSSGTHTVTRDLVNGLVNTVTAAGRQTATHLDQLGRPTFFKKSGEPTIRLQYDGPLLTALSVDGDGVEGSGDERMTTMEYDTITGRPIRVINPLTHQTLFGAYD